MSKPLPKSLASCADEALKLDEEIKDLNKVIGLKEERLNQLKNHIIDNLPKSQATGVSGKAARAQIEREDIPTPKNWGAIQKYIKKNDAFDLIQRRLSTKAVKQRWESGKKIPGVEVFTRVYVKLSKLKGKEKANGKSIKAKR